MHVLKTNESDLSFDFIPHRSQPTKYPNVLLIKPSIAAKRERGETWKRICYGFQQDDDCREINSKQGNMWSPLNGTLLSQLLNVLSYALYNIHGKDIHLMIKTYNTF